MKIYSVEFRLGGRPFFVEILDRILDGKPLSIIAPHVRTLTKWGLDLWFPSPNAVVAPRLSFRPPEVISPLNCRILADNIESAPDAKSALKGADCPILIREWEEFGKLMEGDHLSNNEHQILWTQE